MKEKSEVDCTICELPGYTTDGLPDYVIYACPGCAYLHILHVRCAPDWMKDQVLDYHRDSIVEMRVN